MVAGRANGGGHMQRLCMEMLLDPCRGVEVTSDPAGAEHALQTADALPLRSASMQAGRDLPQI